MPTAGWCSFESLCAIAAGGRNGAGGPKMKEFAVGAGLAVFCGAKRMLNLRLAP